MVLATTSLRAWATVLLCTGKTNTKSRAAQATRGRALMSVMYNTSALKFQGIFLALAAVALAASPCVRAEKPPPLSRQQTWTEKDKADFLKYLNSNQPSASGQSKELVLPSEQKAAEAGKKWSSHAARALEIGPAATVIYPFTQEGHIVTATPMYGGRMLYVQHFRPWIRGYLGLEVSAMRQRHKDDTWGRMTRWAVPVGLEFALVPLATPQTRYVLLRMGVVGSHVASPDQRSDFVAPIIGDSAAWNIGLGYEWQLADSNWRVNAAFDGLRAMEKKDEVGYYGLGGTIGLAYTF